MLCATLCSHSVASAFPQDASGEKLRGAAGVLGDRVRAGGHAAVRAARPSDSPGSELQNRGQARSGELDPPRPAGTERTRQTCVPFVLCSSITLPLYSQVLIIMGFVLQVPELMMRLLVVKRLT